MKSYIYSLIIIFVFVGCDREINTDKLASFPDVPEVFIDDFTSDLQYAAWGNITSFEVDMSEVHTGTASMRIDVPEPNNPLGDYAGGNFYSTTGRNLSKYNALTFYAKSTVATEIEVGIGDGGNYKVSVSGLKLNSSWNKYVIPIPNSSKLVSETGLFYYAAGAVDGNGYTIWFDDVRFEYLGTMAHPEISDFEIAAFPGEIPIGNIEYSVNLPNAMNQKALVSSAYFTYSSSDTDVVTVEGNVLSLKKKGEAVVTVEEADGMITVKGTEMSPQPEIEQSDVISLFSDYYDDVLSANWNPGWDGQTVSEMLELNGQKIMHYSNLGWVSVILDSPANCTDMNYLHVDIMTSNEVTPDSKLLIKIGRAGTETSFTVNQSTQSDFLPYNWVSVDIPLTNSYIKESIESITFSSENTNIKDLYVDNVFFHSSEVQQSNDSPASVAPVPDIESNKVISLLSNTLGDKANVTWSADWDLADVEDFMVEGGKVKKYILYNYVGLEFTSDMIDASDMEYVHFDLWTNDVISDSEFKIKLVDFGSDAAYGGDDDSYHQFSVGEIISKEWNQIDIPLSSFSELKDRAHIAQIVFEVAAQTTKTVYLDNIYFYKE